MPQDLHVLIVGGGFGGLEAARALARAPVRVTLVDRRNHHLFQPLLYQVATAALSPADIASPIRHVLRRQHNVQVLMGDVARIEAAERLAVLTDGTRIRYDFLVVATGATHHYFGHPEWEPIAPGLKTTENAVEIRRRFLLAFEAAEQEPDAEKRRALLTFVVVGAGPTGVEMAGSMAEIARRSLVRDFRNIDPSTARIILLEGGPRVLPAYGGELSAYAQSALERLGVEVRTGSIVTHVDAEAVYIGVERIPARNVVWAAGVTASPLGSRLGAPTDRVGRPFVEPDLSVPGRPEVFVIGDLAAFRTGDGDYLPGVAQVAMQQGRAAAANIRRTLADEPRQAFEYNDKGSMATIGRYAAVAEIGGVRLKGLVAWAIWLFIHVLFLIGFRNRAAVFLQWAWSFLTWQRGARLITGSVGPNLDPPGKPLGTPVRDEATRSDAEAAEQQAQTAPPDRGGKGWMSADADQDRR
jgi:NADH:ubiquinone reductase (H+-translocating)